MPVCSLEYKESHNRLYLILTGVICANITSLIVFLSLLFYNKKLKAGCTGGNACTLTMRYQVIIIVNSAVM